MVTALSPSLWNFIDVKSCKGPQSSCTCHYPLSTPAPLFSPSQWMLPLPRGAGLGRVALFDMACGRCDPSSSLRSAVCSSLALCPHDLLEELSQGSCYPFSLIPRMNAPGKGLNPACSLTPSPVNPQPESETPSQNHLTSARLHLTCTPVSMRVHVCFLVSHWALGGLSGRSWFMESLFLLQPCSKHMGLPKPSLHGVFAGCPACVI